MPTRQTPGLPPERRPDPYSSSQRWNAPRPQRGSFGPPEPPEQPWKKYLLPGAGAAALLVVVVVVALILTSGGDDDGEAEELAIDADATATAEMLAIATPTVEATEEAATPTPEESEPTLTPSPEPTPTEEPAEEEPEPTATPEPPPPTPVPEPPLVGDFGELPPGDMPSGSAADALNLQFNLDMGLGAVPSQATTYQMHRRQWTADDVQGVLNNLNIDGALVDQGGGSFQAEGSTGALYISSSSTQYVNYAPPEGVPALPDNDSLVQYARSWMTGNGLAGVEVGSGQVLDRDEGAGRAFVLLKPANPANIISATPSAGITVRGDGVVVEATINWPASMSGSTYGLRSAESLWADATQGRGFVDVNVNDLPPNFQGAAGTVSITGSGIAYTVAGGQYLVPVVVFSGTASIEGGSNAIPIRIYVQAAAAQSIPRG